MYGFCIPILQWAVDISIWNMAWNWNAKWAAISNQALDFGMPQPSNVDLLQWAGRQISTSLLNAQSQKPRYQIPNTLVVWEINRDSLAELTAAWMVAVQHAKRISNQIWNIVCRIGLPCPQTNQPTLLNAPSPNAPMHCQTHCPIPNELVACELEISLRKRQCH